MDFATGSWLAAPPAGLGEDGLAESQLIATLQQMFACSAATADGIAARAVAKSWPPHSALVRQGVSSNETYLLIVGTARASLVTADGRMMRLHDLSPGDLFGAIDAAVEQAADVITLGSAQTAGFAARDFIALVEQHACVGLLLSRSLVRRLGWMTEKLLERSTLSAAGRVHAELLRLARAGDGRTLTPPPVLADLAQRIQTTRETVSRTISTLERRGLITRTPEALTIVAPHRLEDLIY